MHIAFYDIFFNRVESVKVEFYIVFVGEEMEFLLHFLILVNLLNATVRKNI